MNTTITFTYQLEDNNGAVFDIELFNLFVYVNDCIIFVSIRHKITRALKVN